MLSSEGKCEVSCWKRDWSTEPLQQRECSCSGEGEVTTWSQRLGQWPGQATMRWPANCVRAGFWNIKCLTGQKGTSSSLRFESCDGSCPKLLEFFLITNTSPLCLGLTPSLLSTPNNVKMSVIQHCRVCVFIAKNIFFLLNKWECSKMRESSTYSSTESLWNTYGACLPDPLLEPSSWLWSMAATGPGFQSYIYSYSYDDCYHISFLFLLQILSQWSSLPPSLK